MKNPCNHKLYIYANKEVNQDNEDLYTLEFVNGINNRSFVAQVMSYDTQLLTHPKDWMERKEECLVLNSVPNQDYSEKPVPLEELTLEQFNEHLLYEFENYTSDELIKGESYDKLAKNVMDFIHKEKDFKMDIPSHDAWISWDNIIFDEELIRILGNEKKGELNKTDLVDLGKLLASNVGHLYPPTNLTYLKEPFEEILKKEPLSADEKKYSDHLMKELNLVSPTNSKLKNKAKENEDSLIY